METSPVVPSANPQSPTPEPVNVQLDDSFGIVDLRAHFFSALSMVVCPGGAVDPQVSPEHQDLYRAIRGSKHRWSDQLHDYYAVPLVRPLAAKILALRPQLEQVWSKNIFITAQDVRSLRSDFGALHRFVDPTWTGSVASLQAPGSGSSDGKSREPKALQAVNGPRERLCIYSKKRGGWTIYSYDQKGSIASAETEAAAVAWIENYTKAQLDKGISVTWKKLDSK